MRKPDLAIEITVFILYMWMIYKVGGFKHLPEFMGVLN